MQFTFKKTEVNEKTGESQQEGAPEADSLLAAYFISTQPHTVVKAKATITEKRVFIQLILNGMGTDGKKSV